MVHSSALTLQTLLSLRVFRFSVLYYTLNASAPQCLFLKLLDTLLIGRETQPFHNPGERTSLESGGDAAGLSAPIHDWLPPCLRSA